MDTPLQSLHAFTVDPTREEPILRLQKLPMPVFEDKHSPKSIHRRFWA